MNGKNITAIVILMSACGGTDREPTGPATPVASVQAVVTISGVHLDADGFDLLLNGANQRRMGGAGSVTFENTATGDHTIELKDVAENCSIAGANPRALKVAAGTKTTTTFEVTCAQVPLGIVFGSNRVDAGTLDIVNVRADGTGPLVQITRGQAFLLAVSRDGSRVAFTSPRSGNADIFIVNADGSALRNLSQHPATDSYPTFSPDGSKVAFMSGRDGTSDIFVMNSDGTGVINLTSSAASEQEPDWCSNGRIAFVRSVANRQADVYSMNADGTDVRRITTDNVIANTPRWSPDCSRIAFASIRHAGANGHAADDLDLYLVNADGTGMVRLTSTPGFDVAPSWSPDGARIAFATRRDGNGEVYIMNADGTGAINLTRNPGIDDSPIWVR